MCKALGSIPTRRKGRREARREGKEGINEIKADSEKINKINELT
jgi:hypothetical protein